MKGTHRYLIRLDGHLTDLWSDWFEGLSLEQDPDGVTLIRASLPDQAALLALLSKINALNVTILAVSRVSQEE